MSLTLTHAQDLFYDCWDDLVREIGTAVRDVNSVLDDKTKDNGYFVAMLRATGVIRGAAIGVMPEDKWATRPVVATEKSARLKANRQHKSSWQSGDHHLPKDERKFWGGAIDVHGLILSFTGAPELGDEATMLLAAVRMGLLSEVEALEIATISTNTVYTSVIRLYPYE